MLRKSIPSLALLAVVLFSTLALATDYGTFRGPFEYEVEFRHMAMDSAVFDEGMYSQRRVWSYGWNQETGELVFSNKGWRGNAVGEQLQEALRKKGIRARYVPMDTPGTRRLFRRADLFDLPHRPCAEAALVGGEGLRLRDVSSISGSNPTTRAFKSKAFPGGFQWEPCHSHCRRYMGAAGPDEVLERFMKQSGSSARRGLAEVADEILSRPRSRFAFLFAAGIIFELSARYVAEQAGAGDFVIDASGLVAGEVGTALVEIAVFETKFFTTALKKGAWTRAFASSMWVGFIYVAMLGYEVNSAVHARINEPGFNGFTPEEDDAWLMHIDKRGMDYWKAATAGFFRSHGRYWKETFGF